MNTKQINWSFSSVPPLKKPSFQDKQPIDWKRKVVLICLAIPFCIWIGWILFNLLISPINRLLGLPEVDNLAARGLSSSIEVYDKDNQFVCVLQGDQDRQIISLRQVSTPLKQALIAAEDRNFYSHEGVSFLQIIRAAFINLKSGELKQGGSTITQQLAKNVFFSFKEWKSWQRKVKEVFLALEIEKKYSKDEILSLYLNRVYWGKSAYGVQRAAQRYFNTDASELTIAQSAYLVSLLSSPSTLHQSRRSQVIQHQIINSMERFGYITSKQKEQALKEKLKFESAPGNLSKHPYYMSVVLDELRSRYSEHEITHGGFKVYTSLDPAAQEQAEEILAKGIKRAPSGISQGALVTIDVPSSQVRVIVGGVGDFWKNQWNRATSRHTLGSSFKPFVYLTAFLQGALSSTSPIMDTPLFYREPDTGQTWEPKNFDNDFWGEITVRKALVNSRNIPAIRAGKKANMNNVQQVAARLGLTEIEPYLSSALGSSSASPLEMASAYATLARDGIQMKPIIIRRIVDQNGKVIEQNEPSPERAILSAAVRELVSILEDVVGHGTGAAARLPGDIPVAGKTGTTDGSRDVWFIGFTPMTVTALWGGNDHNKKASYHATGGGVMAGIWKQFMISYRKLNPSPAKQFPKPLARISLRIDPITGLRATPSTYDPQSREFIPGTQPTKYAPAPTPESIRNYEAERQEEMGYMFNEDEYADIEETEEYFTRDQEAEGDWQEENPTPPLANPPEQQRQQPRDSLWERSKDKFKKRRKLFPIKKNSPRNEEEQIPTTTVTTPRPSPYNPPPDNNTSPPPPQPEETTSHPSPYKEGNNSSNDTQW